MNKHDVRLDYLDGVWEVAVRKPSESHRERWQPLGRTGSHRTALRLSGGLVAAETRR